MSTNNIYCFLCNVTCACNQSKKYKNILALTSLAFTVPTVLLLQEGWYILGTSTGILIITSTIYHTIHKSWIRAIDVILLNLIGGGTGAYIIINTIIQPSGTTPLIFCITITCYIILNFINFAPCCSYEAPCGSVIYLQYHAFVHIMSSILLSIVAVGFDFK